MIDPVVVEFALGGLSNIAKAFATIETRLQKMEATTSQSASRGSRDRVKTASDEERAKVRAAAATLKEKERLERQASRDAANEASRRDGIHRRSSEMAGRYAVQQAKADAKAAADGTRAIEREEGRRMRVRIRSAEMAGRIAAKQAADEIRQAERAAARWGVRGARIGGIASRSVGSLVSGVGSMVGATLGIGGGMLLANAASREMSAERQAGLLINTVTTGGKPPAEASMGNILGQAGALSKVLGVDKSEIVGGALEYSRKARGGDIKGALGNMGFFAEMSKVTGADINEIAGAAGTLQSQNKDLKAPEMQQMLLDVYSQGKAGSMSMVDVAKQIGVMASTRGAFSGDMATNQRKLMALGQIAAPEGSVEEAGTFVKDLVMEAGKHRFSTQQSVGLEQMGVKFNKYGQLDSPEQMIGKVMSYYKGDITKIEKTFGARGKAVFGALQPEYVAAGGGAAGDAAVQARLATAMGTPMTLDQLHSQNAQIDSSPAQAFHNALNKVTEDLQEKLAPALSDFATKTLPKLIPKFEAIIDGASKLAGYFADNPIYGIGAVISLAIANDLAAAGITAAAEAGVAAIMKRIMGAAGGGTSGSTPVPGSSGGTLGKVGAVAGALTAGVAVGEVIAPLIFDPIYDAKTKDQQAALATTNVGSNMAAQLRAKARSGNVTAADLAAAQKMAAALGSQKSAQELEAAGFHSSASVPLIGALSAPGAAAADGALKNTAMSLDALNKSIALATANLAKMGSTASNADPRRNLPISQRPTQ